MTDQSLDSLLRQVLLDADSQEYGDMMEILPEHDFSPGFERRMKKLIRRADHPMRYRVAQVAACLLLAALLSGCTVLAISPEAREAFVGWVREVHEAWFVYRYTGEDQKFPKDTVFQVTWLPDGFAEVTHSASEDQVQIHFQDENSNSIIFVYSRGMGSANLFIDENGVEAQSVQIGHLYADLYLDQQPDKANALVWSDRGVLFWLHGNCSGEELIKIAESIEAQEAPKELAEYRPTWLPDGYSESLVPELGDQVNVLYSDSEGHTMLFLYANSSTMLYIFPEQDSFELIHVTVNDIPADFYLDSDDAKANWLIWEHPENDLIFGIGGNLSQDIMIRVAESVEAVQ